MQWQRKQGAGAADRQGLQYIGTLWKRRRAAFLGSAARGQCASGALPSKQAAVFLLLLLRGKTWLPQDSPSSVTQTTAVLTAPLDRGLRNSPACQMYAL